MSGKQTQIEDQKTTPAAAAGVVNTVEVVDVLKTETPETLSLPVRPEWLDELLKSNEAVISSNTAVVNSVNKFKELAGGLVKEIFDSVKVNAEQSIAASEAKSLVKTNLPVFNPDADYEVVVQFRDSKDFSKIYKVGDDVTHLGEDRLRHLLITGNVEEA